MLVFKVCEPLSTKFPFENPLTIFASLPSVKIDWQLNELFFDEFVGLKVFIGILFFLFSSLSLIVMWFLTSFGIIIFLIIELNNLY